MVPGQENSVSAIEWRDDALWLLDQRALPVQEVWLEHQEVAAVVESIRAMVVRGAPAIGITAAYGVVLAARNRRNQDAYTWREQLEQDLEALAQSRPTAVNLFWALDQMRLALDKLADNEDPIVQLLREAKKIHRLDVAANHAMGRLGSAVIASYSTPAKGVITHCNTGSLATGGYGTALGVIRSAWQQGLIDRVFADETRPWWQGSRLTAWELSQDKIPVTLMADTVGATLMRQGRISWVIVGADRITANGDVANKIGTYNLAVLAKHHGVRFMVAAPTSTFDMMLSSGEDIPIEERGPDELVAFKNHRLAPDNIDVYNPVFDVTPAELIDAIVTEKGVVESPNLAGVSRLMEKQSLH
ncbi:MAG: S-methyl-5-thioribose-1-phosphate isomerase [Alcanivorax sp.]|nr:S-methyl-5-thioribose-1-phosphate isomerase [Pseudomonadales bacterium]MEC8810614.1 S-methyl-5-thioribose-1-phosphate isomerase [Pseudomonadota bacterium]TNC88824.1 MAG: S-methyl-5-thioribose-1-phosphate isomerase [Alcanivorax sp.]